MDCDSRIVDLHAIDLHDESYRISAQSAASNLVSSIARVGLINPPFLLMRGQAFVIVSGFARVQACSKLGWHHIPARCLDAGTPRQRCAMLAVVENSSLRDLNIIEQARAVHVLMGCFDSQEELAAAARDIGLVVSPQLIEKLIAVKGLSDQLQCGIAEGTLGMAIALRIHAMFDEQEAENLGCFIRSLDISLTRQKELVDWIETIIHQEGVALGDLISDPQIIQWQNSTHIDGPQKSSLIRAYLRNRCYPTLCAFEQRYNRAVKQIGLAPSLRLSPPPNFEGSTFSLRVDFNSPEDLVLRLNETQRLAASPALQALFDLRLESE